MRRRRLALLGVLSALVTMLPLAAPAPADAAVTRLAGSGRYSTSVEVSRANPWPTGGTVYLASGEGFADALAAGPVAAAERARLLLARHDEIPAPVVEEIERLAPTTIVLVGGEAALGHEVAMHAALLAGSVVRVAGSDRVETSMLLLDRMARFDAPTALWVVSAGGFADALAAGAVAARRGEALVLTWGANDRFQALLEPRADAITRVNIAGGTAAVSTSTRAYLMSAVTSNVPRYWDTSRYGTAVVINRTFTSSATGATMLLASGQSFPDGLVAGVLAAARGVPLYLTPSACATSDGVASEVTRLGITSTIVVGGTAAVSAAAASLTRCTSITPTMQRMLDLVNAERAEAGVAPLRWDDDLGSLAQSWTTRMASAASATHNPDFCDVTFDLGYRRCGENIAWTSSSDPAAPMSFWVGSPGHYANLTNASFTHVGFGVAQAPNGYWYWTQNFAG